AGFPHIDLFDAAVAEEGGLILWPSGSIEQLGPRRPDALVAELQRRGVKPLDVGRVIVSTHQPHDQALQTVITDLGLDYHLHYNRHEVMALPRGIDKGSGLRALAKGLGISLDEFVGIGDGE